MFELRLLCRVDQIEPLSSLLEDAGAASVAVEDADAGTAAEQALFAEPGLPPGADGWQRSQLSALFLAEPAALAASQIAAAQAQSLAHCKVLGITEVPDQDWVRLTQSQFTPVEIGPGFWVVPSWHQPPAAARRVIRLDPGLAFGTGTHATTQMCLRWLARFPGRFERVLDYGCGSGILAIGAALCGATAIDAVDIDDAAIDSTKANATANGVSLRVGRPDLATGRYDLVLANILASPLKVLAPLLCSRVAAHGALVLAGILERQADELLEVYARHLPLSVADRQDGWVLLTTPDA